MEQNRSRLGLLILVLSTVAGCGDGRPARVPVAGQVLIDGQPLAHGHIQFIPQGARASRSALDEQGRFVLRCFESNDGAVPGTHRIVISGAEPVGSTKTIWHAPKKYTTANTSGLTQEITGPADNVVINITWSGGKPFIEDDNTGVIEPYQPAIHKPAK